MKRQSKSATNSNAATLSPKNLRVQRALLRQQLAASLPVPSVEEETTPNSNITVSATPNYAIRGATTTRFRTGDYVLVRSNQGTNLVNRYGFPPGQGKSAQETHGPYHFVVGVVKQVHYEEMIPYYTITRMDTNVDQRSDAEIMHPIQTPQGERAAIRAATRTDGQNESDADLGVLLPGHNHLVQKVFDCLGFPFVWIGNLLRVCLETCFWPCLRSFWRFIMSQARAILNGRWPYICQLRLTMVNLVVLCSTWFLFIDQARLAFLPPDTDRALAIVNFVVWLVLVVELLLEVFIRPNDYSRLVHSDKAFAPTTMRFIDGFHLLLESVSLGIFIPEFRCLFTNQSCGSRWAFSVFNAFILGLNGKDLRHVFYGGAFIALTRLRVFGLVRHWKNMWITNQYIGDYANHVKAAKPGTIHDKNSFMDSKAARSDLVEVERKQKEAELTSAATIGTALMATNSHRTLASVWVIVGLFPLVIALCGVFGNHVAEQMTDQLQQINLLASDTSNETCDYLNSSVDSWLHAVISREVLGKSQPFLLTLEMNPPRCGLTGLTFTNSEHCEREMDHNDDACDLWNDLTSTNVTTGEVAEKSGIREGSIIEYNVANENVTWFPFGPASPGTSTFSVHTRFDMTASVRTAAISSLLLQFCLLGVVLGGLFILRRDSELLALGPLRRMLKIVARYARNPLVQPKTKRKSPSRLRIPGRHNTDDDDSSMSEAESPGTAEFTEVELGSYETEQLLTAVAKITDLLRKCWGVAGADIISTNLSTREGALTEVFNPTVPGKSVYALFAFAAIGGFDNAVRNLGGDVMPLINDVANVLHGEVLRWGFGDSGQCNKNLGGAFLMVFRIGLVKEVIEKLEQATNVVFSTGTTAAKTSHHSGGFRRRPNRRTSSLKSSEGSSGSGFYSDRAPSSNTRSSILTHTSTSSSKRRAQASQSTKAMSLSLQSLPGISTFTDRAVIGMLKSYAGIYRDKKVLGWNDDFRLGAGVGAFRIGMIFGMDAGWAVEGAVGSEYKIDATYLSPHVNMASRMTSACKQYDVTIMLSQSVQELMSDTARHKLRHLDTVTVKGSSVKQKIFTYDAQPRGVDFFLFSRPEDSADAEADRYTEKIWNEDMDLLSMRKHVTDDFLKAFRAGHKAYLSGDWPLAIEKLQLANDIMFQNAVDEGYMEGLGTEDEFDGLNLRASPETQGVVADEQKRKYGDGPSMYLINFMKSHGGKAPPDWDGWHPLTRK